ncbi:hypothetical protein GQ44DRAFT_691951 [Phaeosphaeriaceae sp. PMI808]|nr:hypothetical protein GQ44DRAFT_691951 [Phaeosphaeriaceae sp. PMI808]
MSATEQLFQDLDAISERLWDISLENSAFESLKKKVSTLSAQIAVHYALDNTALLLEKEGSLPLSIQSRLGKFIEALYGTSENPSLTNKSRWNELRLLDCESCLFVAESYTPLDISKMHRVEFEYLIAHVPKYLEVRKLPERWMFRREIQVALAEKAELENIAEFKRKYHTLEFTQSERTRKRPRLDVQAVDTAIGSVSRHESTDRDPSVPIQQPPPSEPTSSTSNKENDSQPRSRNDEQTGVLLTTMNEATGVTDDGAPPNGPENTLVEAPLHSTDSHQHVDAIPSGRRK